MLKFTHIQAIINQMTGSILKQIINNEQRHAHDKIEIGTNQRQVQQTSIGMFICTHRMICNFGTVLNCHA